MGRATNRWRTRRRLEGRGWTKVAGGWLPPGCYPDREVRTTLADAVRDDAFLTDIYLAMRDPVQR